MNPKHPTKPHITVGFSKSVATVTGLVIEPESVDNLDGLEKRSLLNKQTIKQYRHRKIPRADLAKRTDGPASELVFLLRTGHSMKPGCEDRSNMHYETERVVGSASSSLNLVALKGIPLSCLRFACFISFVFFS